MSLTAKCTKALLKSARNELRHPEMKWRGQQSRSKTAFRKIDTQTTINEIGHTLGGSGLFAVTL